MEKVRLSVLGITYSEVQSGAYVLILAEENGTRRIPVIVGTAEAQSIAAFIERVQPPRPLTHDLFVSFSHAFGVTLDEVMIYKYEDGVFYSEMTFSNEDSQVSLGSRTSDAIALALRTNAPIYTTPEILEETGLELGLDSNSAHTVPTHKEIPLERYALPELEKMMRKAAEAENYERAAEIKEVIETKKTQKNK